MLFVLTGDIQTGKTRWLEKVVERLVANGVRVDGVLAPGVWVEHPAVDGSASSTFEKLGIDNVLLPQNERIPFARRRDLAELEGTYDEGSQSAAMQMMWTIDDAAIAQVNSHFYALANSVSEEPGLLVVDELGRLELECGKGLSAALDLLDRGASQAHSHALIVVRAGLLDTALNRFATTPWGGIQPIAPDEAGEQAIRSAFALR